MKSSTARSSGANSRTAVPVSGGDWASTSCPLNGTTIRSRAHDRTGSRLGLWEDCMIDVLEQRVCAVAELQLYPGSGCRPEGPRRKTREMAVTNPPVPRLAG